MGTSSAIRLTSYQPDNIGRLRRVKMDGMIRLANDSFDEDEVEMKGITACQGRKPFLQKFPRPVPQRISACAEPGKS